jgi:prepilin-type N-terminal cleavage/methylation domain-containing protein
MKSLNDREGLTLIEVLLGLAISAVIFAIVLGAIRLGQRSQEKGLEREELTQRIRIINDRLGWMLRSAYPYVYVDPEDPENPVLFFKGDQESLAFVTSATDEYSDKLMDLSGLKYVIISAEDNNLVFEEQVFFMGGEDIPEENRYIYERDISELEFSYLDPVLDDEGNPGTPEWTDQWDGEIQTYLPLAVRVRVKLKRGETEVELPPVIAAIRAGGHLLKPNAATAPQTTPGQAPRPKPGTLPQVPQIPR